MDGLANDGRPFRSRDAKRLRLNKNMLTQLVRAGTLRRALNDVYVDVRVPDDPVSRARCVSLVLPGGAVLARRSAAWLWGVDAYGPGEDATRAGIECLSPARRGTSRRVGTAGYSAVLPDEDVTVCHGIPVTTPTRTGVDLARWRPRHEGLAALDALQHAGLTDKGRLMCCAESFAGFRWIAKARELIQLSDPRPESPGESWLRLRIIDAGFPLPIPQVRIVDAAGVLVYRLDLGYPQLRLGLEYDGLQFHDTRTQRAHDEARRADLVRRFGWEVYGFDRGHVLGPVPGVELAVGSLLGIEPRLPRTW